MDNQNDPNLPTPPSNQPSGDLASSLGTPTPPLPDPTLPSNPLNNPSDPTVAQPSSPWSPPSTTTLPADPWAASTPTPPPPPPPTNPSVWPSSPAPTTSPGTITAATDPWSNAIPTTLTADNAGISENSAWTTPDALPPEPATAPIPSPWPAAAQPALNSTPATTSWPNEPQSPSQTPPSPTSDWTPPIQSAPMAEPIQPETPTTPTFITPTDAPAPAEIPSASEPTPTFTPPQPTETPASSLDNPMNVSSQPPTIDGSNNTTQPSWNNDPSVAASPTDNNPPAPLDAAPTDLSHLINSNAGAEPVQAAPETLVTPPNPSAEVQTLPQNHKGIPYWLIGLAIGLLLVVGGASAYFILGIGQPAKTTTSIPAVTTPPQANETKTPAPTFAPRPTQQPVATGSANFGELQASSSPQATSAAELLRQRQGSE